MNRKRLRKATMASSRYNSDICLQGLNDELVRDLHETEHNVVQVLSQTFDSGNSEITQKLSFRKADA